MLALGFCCQIKFQTKLSYMCNYCNVLLEPYRVLCVICCIQYSKGNLFKTLFCCFLLPIYFLKASDINVLYFKSAFLMGMVVYFNVEK